MPTEKEVLTGLLSKVYNFDEPGVTSLYNEDGVLNDNALDTILQKDADRIATFKPDTKKIQDDFYKKGASETMSKLEKELAIKYGLSTEKKGMEFFEHAIDQFKIDNADDPEKIRKHKIFLDEMEKIGKEKSELKTTYEKQLDDFKKQVEREKVFTSISEQAMILFENMKPILPGDAAKAANMKKIFINDLSAMDYEIRNDKIILKDKDGSDLLDNHGNRITFDVFVKSTADKYFEFHAADPKNTPNQPTGKPNTTVFNITSEQDFLELRKTVKPEDKTALTEAYQAFRGRKKTN